VCTKLPGLAKTLCGTFYLDPRPWFFSETRHWADSVCVQLAFRSVLKLQGGFGGCFRLYVVERPHALTVPKASVAVPHEAFRSWLPAMLLGVCPVHKVVPCQKISRHICCESGRSEYVCCGTPLCGYLATDPDDWPQLSKPHLRCYAVWCQNRNGLYCLVHGQEASRSLRYYG